jgi:hypothetical protein
LHLSIVAVRGCGSWLLAPKRECCSRISDYHLFAKPALNIPIDLGTNVRSSCQKVFVL